METQNEKQVTEKIIDEIVNQVYSYYGKDTILAKSKKRKQEIILPKHASIFFIRKYSPKVGYERIANYFEMANHTSVLFAFKKMEWLSKRDKFYSKQMEDIDKLIVENVFKNSSIYDNKHNGCSIVDFTGGKKVLFLGFDKKDVFASVKNMQKQETFKNISHHDSKYIVSIVESKEPIFPQVPTINAEF